MSIQYFYPNEKMSRAVVHGSTGYLCGQVAYDFHGNIKQQSREIFEKIDSLLADIGSDKSKLLSVTIHIKSIDMFKEMNRVWVEWLENCPKPARTTIEAKMAHPDVLVEISVVAAADSVS